MVWMQRVVMPEILDQLDAGDARAQRSMRDLRMINGLMRGEAWIVRELKKMSGVKRVVDLGAGDGCLGAAILRQMPDMEVVCVDLKARPAELDERVSWIQGDLFDCRAYDGHTVVVANLFLHHLSAGQLKRLGTLIGGVYGVLVAEPYRGKTSMFMGRCLFPLVNDVTRHDMMASIRAGFQEDELGAMLGCHFKWHEQRSFFGGIRIKGMRKGRWR